MMRHAIRCRGWLIATSLLLVTAASRADAQMPRSSNQSSIINWMPGDAYHDGYESVSGWFDYYFAPCVGTSITAQLTLRPEVSAAPLYWYKGRRYPLTPPQAAMFEEVRPTRVDFRAYFNATQPKQFTAFEPTTASCSGWTTVASQRAYYPEKASRQEIIDALDRLSISNGTSIRPLRNGRLEQLLEQEVAQARRDSINRVNVARVDSINRARVAQARQDSVTRARAAAQSAGTSRTATAGSNGTSGSGARSSSRSATNAAANAEAQRVADSVNAEAQQRHAAALAAQRAQEMEERRRSSDEMKSGLGAMAASTLASGGRLGLIYGMSSPTGKYAQDFSTIGVMYELEPLLYFHLGASPTLASKMLDAADTTSTEDPLAFTFSVFKGFDWFGVNDDAGMYPLIELGWVFGTRSSSALDAEESWEDQAVVGVGLGARLGGADLLFTASPFFNTSTMRFGVGLKF